MNDILLELELSIPEWNRLRIDFGVAELVPASLRKLLKSTSAVDSKAAYWELEGTVVVSGGLYEAALFVVPVLVAALVDANRPPFARNNGYELLFQIVNADSAPNEVKFGASDLGERCRAKAREGLSVYYRDLVDSDGLLQRNAREIIEILDDDKSRLEAFDRMYPDNETLDPWPKPVTAKTP